MYSHVQNMSVNLKNTIVLIFTHNKIYSILICWYFWRENIVLSKKKHRFKKLYLNWMHAVEVHYSMHSHITAKHFIFIKIQILSCNNLRFFWKTTKILPKFQLFFGDFGLCLSTHKARNILEQRLKNIYIFPVKIWHLFRSGRLGPGRVTETRSFPLFTQHILSSLKHWRKNIGLCTDCHLYLTFS